MALNPIFKDCVVSIAGTLDDHAWREEKVKQWVHFWGGTFSPVVDDRVTHLLCTGENFKKKIASVRTALRSKGTKIVLRDWLEDSINDKKRLKTQSYELGEKAKQGNAKKRKIQKMEKHSSNADNYVDERFWHVYRDTTYFEYKVQLKRDDVESGNVGEQHLLTLWESNAKPCNYRCTTLFTKKKSKNTGCRYPLNETPVALAVALKTFRAFFKKKTGLAWDDRIEKFGSTGPELFQYRPPGGGKPVGLVNGRHASIFGSDGIASPGQQHQQNQANNNNTQARDQNNSVVVINDRKRAREDHVAGNAAGGGAKRPAKKPKHESAVADHATQEVTVVANSDSDDEATRDAKGMGGTDLESENARNRDGDGHDYALRIDGCDNGSQPGLEAQFDVDVDFTSESSRAPQTNAEDDGDNYHDTHDGTEDNTAPIDNDAETALEMAKLYDEAQRAEVVVTVTVATTIHNNQQQDKREEEKADADADTNANISLKRTREIELARAAAANIYYETRRGVSLVRDSQARLIDAVRGARARARARAERESERAMEAADHDGDDDDDESWDGFSDSC
ncbi:hypothetical protein F5X97DRAFT_325291 [Nemania serpens]|nr:hypothetical protein F5X97DRAFT_325291 [Nemania serpens]